MTTPTEAQATFLWQFVRPWDIYRAIARTPIGARGELTRSAAAVLGISERTVQRRVARYWPPATEPQEPGALHELACTNHPCTCTEVILAII